MAHAVSMDNFPTVIPEEDDFYAALGCTEHSSNSIIGNDGYLSRFKVEQITTEYRLRALKSHPDKNQGNEEAAKQYQLLLRAKSVLADEEMRTKYDAWRHCGLLLSWQQWLALQDRTHASMHWAPVKRMPPALVDTESDTKQHQSSKEVDSGQPSDVDGCRQGAMGISQFRRQSKRSSNLSKFREYKE